MLRADLSTVGVSMLLADPEIVFRRTIAGRYQNRCWCLRRWRLPRLGSRRGARGDRPHRPNTIMSGSSACKSDLTDTIARSASALLSVNHAWRWVRAEREVDRQPASSLR